MLHPLRVQYNADHKMAPHSEGRHSIPMPIIHVSHTGATNIHQND